MHRYRNRKTRTNSRGFTLIELMFAIFVLAVGILGSMVMVIVGMSRDNTNRVDTTATNVAQTVVEAISGTSNKANVIAVSDCVPNTLTINAAPGGATLQANGDIDFLADSAATLNASNYQMNYTVCGTNGLQTVYDVRWNVKAVGNWGKLVTVSARQPFVASQNGISSIRPVTLRTVVSR